VEENFVDEVSYRLFVDEVSYRHLLNPQSTSILAVEENFVDEVSYRLLKKSILINSGFTFTKAQGKVQKKN
jgi:hypothetical protein